MPVTLPESAVTFTGIRTASWARTQPTYTDIFVNVVDAFQGREADILLFSLTRSGADRSIKLNLFTT